MVPHVRPEAYLSKGMQSGVFLQIWLAMRLNWQKDVKTIQFISVSKM